MRENKKKAQTIFILGVIAVLLFLMFYMSFKLYRCMNECDDVKNTLIEESEFQESVRYKLMCYSDAVISIRKDVRISLDGTSGFSLVQAISFDTTSGHVISLDEIFLKTDYEAWLRDTLLSQIVTQYPTIEEITCPLYGDILNEVNISEMAWYFNDKGLCFAFPEGIFNAYVYGCEVVVIPYELLQGKIQGEYIIAVTEKSSTKSFR